MMTRINVRASLERIVRELPPFAIALGVAEAFFKLGSFSLEVILFVALWQGLRAAQETLSSWPAGRGGDRSE